MIICRKGQQNGGGRHAPRLEPSSPENGQPGQGGPVFMPPRKPSAMARALLEQIRDSNRVDTNYPKLFSPASVET